MAATSNQACTSCLEDYDLNQRRLIECPKCQLGVCQQCLFGFIKSNLMMPTCTRLECRFEFTEAFLFKIIPKKEVATVRRLLREILFEQQRSMSEVSLERIQNGLSRFTQPIRKVNPEKKLCKDAYIAIKERIHKMNRAKDWLALCRYKKISTNADGVYHNTEFNVKVQPERVEQSIRTINTKLDTINKELVEAGYRYAATPRYIYVDGTGRVLTNTEAVAAASTSKVADKAPRRAFVFPCGVDDCKGFLSTQWVCMRCKKKKCKDCHNTIEDKNQHKCDPNEVASAKFKMEDTRPCPKCGSRIHRISGCPHMFCPACNHGFDWANGATIALEQNSNHLAYEYRRSLGGGGGSNGNITIGGEHQTCAEQGQAVDTFVLSCRMFAMGLSNAQVAMAIHFRNLIDPNNAPLNNELVTHSCDEHREQFLLGMITAKQLADRAYTIYRKNQRNNHHNGLKTMLRELGTDLLNWIIQAKTTRVAVDSLQAIDALVKYVNQQFYQINTDYLYKSFPYITPYMHYIPRANESDLKRTYYPPARIPLQYLRIMVDESGMNQIQEVSEQLLYITNELATHGINNYILPEEEPGQNYRAT